MGLFDKLKEEIRNRRYDRQIADNFENKGVETALMTGFTRKAQNLFMHDLADEWAKAVRPVAYTDAGEKMSPKEAIRKASDALYERLASLGENEQDAWLYNSRFPSRAKKNYKKEIIGEGGWIRDLHTGKKGSVAKYDGENISLPKNDNYLDFIEAAVHEGGHKSNQVQLKEHDISQRGNLGDLLRKEKIDELQSKENVSEEVNKLIEDISDSTAREAAHELLYDAVGNHPDFVNNHKKDYYDVLDRHAHGPKYQPAFKKWAKQEGYAEDIANNWAMSDEAFAEMYQLLSAPGGREWAQKNIPSTLKKFNEFTGHIKSKYDDIYTKLLKDYPDNPSVRNAVINEKYNVDFHPELKD